MQADRSSAVLLGNAPVTVGVGTRFVPGVHVDLVVDDFAIEAPDVNERLIARADGPGWFTTSQRIGARVRVGEVVGHLARRPFVAPTDGVLRGLSARGARVHPGVEVIEVDPGGTPASCFGLGQRQRLIAAKVMKALAAHVAREPASGTSASQRGFAASLIG